MSSPTRYSTKKPAVRILALSVLLGLTGCTDSSAIDGGATPDAGSGSDAGRDAADAGGNRDAGGDAADAGNEADAGGSSDAGGPSDAPPSFYDPDGTIIYADRPTMPQIEAARPGDVLLFEPGEHDRIDLDGIVSTECDPLVLVSLDPSNPALIRNTSVPGWEAVGIDGSAYVVLENLVVEDGIQGILITDSQHVIVMGSEVRQSGLAGIRVRDFAEHVDLIGNVIHDTGQRDAKWGEGIYLGTSEGQGDDTVTHVWVEDNEIYETGFGEGVELKGGVRFSTVRGNHVHDIRLGLEGGQTNEAAIVMGARSRDLAHNWVEHNLVENVSWGGGGEAGRPNVGASGIAVFAGGNYVHSNTVRNVLEWGIYLNAYLDSGHFVYEWNNTVSDAAYDDFRVGGLSNLTRSDPGMRNPNTRQQWCAE